MKLIFSAAVFWKNEGGGSLFPASKWCLPPPPMPEGSCPQQLTPPSLPLLTHTIRTHALLALRDQRQHTPQDLPAGMTHPQHSLHLQSLAHSPELHEARVRPLSYTPLYKPPPSFPPEKGNYYLLSQSMSNATHGLHFQDVCSDTLLSLPPKWVREPHRDSMVSSADLPWFILSFNKNLPSTSHHLHAIALCSHKTEPLGVVERTVFY